MTVNEAPAAAPGGTLLSLPAPDGGGATRFASLLNGEDLHQASGLRRSDGSYPQSTASLQRKGREKRDDALRPSETASANTAQVDLNQPRVALAMTEIACSSFDLSKLTGATPENTVGDVSSAIQPSGTSAQMTSEHRLHRSAIAAAEGASAEDVPHEDRQTLQSTASLDSSSALTLVSKDIPLIDFRDSSANGDMCPHVEPSQLGGGQVNASTTPSGKEGLDVAPPKMAALISGNDPQPHGTEPSSQLPNATMIQQPSTNHDESRPFSGFDSKITMTPHAGAEIPSSTSSAADRVQGEEDGLPLVEAFGESPESTRGGPGHRDQPHGPDPLSSPERLPARAETVAQSATPFTDLQQMSAIRTSVGQTTYGAGGDAAPSHSASSTQAAFQRVADFNAGRELQNALRGDLRVGVPTEVFGHVTIQTTSTAGQVSAQVLLEDVRQSAVLAGHIPVVEQRIMQHLGLDASVRLAAGTGSGAAAGGFGGEGHGGETSREGRPSPESGRPATAVRSLLSTHGLKEERTSSSVHGSQMPSTRLDLRV